MITGSSHVLEFAKMSGAGNDFVVIDNRLNRFSDEELSKLAVRLCPRRKGIGADGLLALNRPDDPAHAYRMRYFNADGSAARMCGNGARCLARFAERADGAGSGARNEAPREMLFESDAGIHRAQVPDASEASVRIFFEPPRDFQAAVVLQTGGLAERLPGPVHFVWTGTEHAVLFVDQVQEVPVGTWGTALRRDDAFRPAGANANFVEVVQNGAGKEPATLRMRTFEKGVEDETLACGTGAMAAVVVAHRLQRIQSTAADVNMPGGLLRAGFRIEGETVEDENVRDLYLEGPAETVFEGTVEV